jgi:hypothetical protein
MHACVIMHNMTIKSERGGPATTDNHQYDFQGPLANVDHLILQSLLIFSPYTRRSVMK